MKIIFARVEVQVQILEKQFLWDYNGPTDISLISHDLKYCLSKDDYDLNLILFNWHLFVNFAAYTLRESFVAYNGHARL